MSGRWSVGSVTAIGIGVGAGFAASVGPVGYLIGLVASLGTFGIARELQRRRHLP